MQKYRLRRAVRFLPVGIGHRAARPCRRHDGIYVSDRLLQQAILGEVAPQGRGVKRLLDPVAEQQVAHLFRRQQMDCQVLY